MLFRRLFALLLLPVLVACQTAPQNNNNPPIGPPILPPPQRRIEPEIRYTPPTHFKDHWTQETPTPHGSSSLKPFYGRQARRLSIDQLKTSIPLLFGGITWMSGTTNLFDSLSKTLGKADYIEITAHSVEPSPLFMKFMEDMATSVCIKAVEKDLKATSPQERVFVRTPEETDPTLRFIRLKFHSILVPETTTKGIDELRSLYDKVAAATTSPSKAWQAVCVAVLTSPEFLAY